MKILALDTSSNVASVAIVEDEKLIYESVLNNKLTHSQTIMPMVDNAMKLSELTMDDIDLFAVSNGPGSFTGLRIGVTTAKALAHATKKPIVGVNTLEAMAYNLPFCPYLVAPIMDARREEVYGAVYSFESGQLREILSPVATALADFLDEIKGFNNDVVFLGDGMPVFKGKIQEILGNKAHFAPQSCNAQRASGVAEAAKNKEFLTYSQIVPVYLRKSQAERELEERNNKKC